MTTALLDPPPPVSEPVDDGTRREFLAGGLALSLGLSACGGQGGDPAGEGRRFTDSLGRVVRIAERPRRIVALHDNSAGQALLSIGAPVVGLVERDGRFDVSLDPYDLSSVTGLGDYQEIDVEQAAALRPDLVVGMVFRGQYSHGVDVEVLQRIAPTVILEADRPVDAYMRDIATLTGREEAAARQRERFEGEFAQLESELGGRARTLELALVFRLPDGGVSLLSTADPKPVLKLAARLGAQVRAQPGELSGERLLDLDADIVLYEPDGDPSALALWPRVSAVREGQAFEVPKLQGNDHASFLRAVPVLRRVLVDAEPVTRQPEGGAR